MHPPTGLSRVVPKDHKRMYVTGFVDDQKCMSMPDSCRINVGATHTQTNYADTGRKLVPCEKFEPRH